MICFVFGFDYCICIVTSAPFVFKKYVIYTYLITCSDAPVCRCVICVIHGTQYTEFDLRNTTEFSILGFHMQWKTSILNSSWIFHMLMQSDGMSANWQSIQVSTFSKWAHFFAFVLYLICNKLDFPISLCLKSCLIFRFCYFVYLIYDRFLR
jgi:hypothetical protein